MNNCSREQLFNCSAGDVLYVTGLYQCVCRWWLYYKALSQSGRILVSMESPTWVWILPMWNEVSF